MSPRLSVKAFFDLHGARIGLTWRAGEAGAERAILGSDEQRSRASLVGYLNIIHPNRVQVLGHRDCLYLRELGKNSLKDALTRLFAEEPACIIYADDEPVADGMQAMADATGTALFHSSMAGHRLVAHLQYYLGHMLADRVSVHGVFLEVMGLGVLLTGEPGVGKSELALELISRGHRLVADDTPQFARIALETLEGRCTRELCEFMEVRGLGILNVRSLFGDSAIKRRKIMRLIVNLKSMSVAELTALDRLEGTHSTRTLLDVEIPEITLPLAPGRNFAVLVETAVRNHILRLKGYNSAEDFIAKQQELINRGGTGLAEN